jgi:large subunit ribosomal protein L1
VAALVESKGRTIDFDRAVGHPSMMPSLVRAAKILGPKGLMPNPKVRAHGHACVVASCMAVDLSPLRGLLRVCMRMRGACNPPPPLTAKQQPNQLPTKQTTNKTKVGTLTPDVAAAVREMRRGRVEFKVDRGANIHAPIGRVSMPRAQLQANLGALTAALLRAKPAAIKGGLAKYVAKVTVCSTMGPGVEVEPSSLMAALDAAAKAEGGSGGEGGNKAAAAASA